MVTRGSRWPLMIDPQGQVGKGLGAGGAHENSYLVFGFRYREPLPRHSVQRLSPELRLDQRALINEKYLVSRFNSALQE